MRIRACLILGCMVAMVEILSVGQNAPSQSPSSQSSGDASTAAAPAGATSAISGLLPEGGTGDTNSSLPQIPALLGGMGISTTVLSEMEKSNYLRGGLNVGAVYDSNPLLVSSGAESNTSESVFPNIKIDETSSRMRWSLAYAGGLTVNQKFTNQNQGSQNLNFDSQFRLSPHVNLRVAEAFSMSTGFFDAGNGAEAIGGSGGTNANLITPLATQESDVTTVETNYHFALNDLIGASGSFSDSHFSNVAAGGELANTQTATASAFWLHQLFPGDWGGVSYHFQRITYNPSGETLVHSFLAVDTVTFSKQYTLTGFIGPQYSENQGLVPGALQASNTSNWSVGGGADFGWKNQSTSVSAGYARTINNGGGLLGAVLLQTVHGSFRRQFNSKWAAVVTGSYSTNQAQTVPLATSASSIDLTSAGFSVERNVAKSLGLRMGYTHDFQQQMGVPGAFSTSPLQTLDASRNRFFFTLSYQWAKPLGM
jgi:hypothetical protein